LLTGLACVALPSRRALVVRLLAALLLLLLAIGVRHNAAAAAWPFLALPALRLLPIRRRWLRVPAAGLLGLILAFGLTKSIEVASAPLVQRTEFWQTVPTFDLAGMSLQLDELLVEPETEVFTQGMGLEQIRLLFSIEYGPRLYYCLGFRGKRCVPLFRRTQDAEQLRQLSANWQRAVREHPGAYLAHRAAFARELLTVNLSHKLLYYLNGAPHHPLAADYPPTRRSLRVMAKLEHHLKSPVYQPWIYGLLCLVLIPVGLFRYARGEHGVTLALALSGSCYLLSTIVAGSTTDFRYSVWTIACAVLGLCSLLLSLGRAKPAPQPS
jgi:hypothetical protein